MFVIVMLF